MPTNRNPINRATKSRISPTAVLAFQEMLKLEARCTCTPINWSRYWEGRDPCTACKRWREHHSVLWHELKLPPWEWPAFEHSDATTPYPEGSYAAQSWKPDEAGQRRYRALCDAAGVDETVHS